VDPDGNALYLFGGGRLRGTSLDLYNDLYKFSLEYFMWAIIGGSTSPNNNGNYGVKTIRSESNLPPAKAAAGYAFDQVSRKWYFHAGFRSGQGTMNDVWEFVDDYPQPEVLDENYYDANSDSVGATTTTEKEKRTRTFAPEESSAISKNDLSPEAVVGIAAGAAFIVVLGLLFLLKLIRRQSFKEAIMQQAATSVAVDSSTVTETESKPTSPSKGSSLLNLKSISVPSPIVQYSTESVLRAKNNAPVDTLIDGSFFDAVQQIGTQNGVPMYNGVYKTDGKANLKAIIKVYGSDSFSMQKGVENAFWKEIELLRELRDVQGITKVRNFQVD
jgi:hypothetical protein